MRILLTFSVLLCPLILQAGAPSSPEKAVAAVLDDFHAAAAQADEPRYFGHFAKGAVFLGTDPTERWTVEQFRVYAHERFSKGQGWTYVPSERSVVFGAKQTVAWFHEVVTNASYGKCRGTGTLVLEGGKWKIAQYSLSLPLPNRMFKDIADKVRGYVAK
ncbi:MAG: nuclear transport factor 2 family protein [Myxococcota bacterium]